MARATAPSSRGLATSGLSRTNLVLTMVNIHEAKTHFSKLVARAAAGEEIVITKAGEPMCKLVPLSKRTEPRRPGLLKGKIEIFEGFDDPLPEFETYYENGEQD